MKNSLLKRWGSILVALALFAQISVPTAFATEDTDDSNDVPEAAHDRLLEEEVTDFLKRAKRGRHLYQVRWGVLAKSGQERCLGALKADILSALDSNDSPDCEVVKADYVGSLAVNVGEVQVKKEILFENNDEVTNSGGEAVEWTSHIAGHWDGLMIEYKPDEESDEKVLITLSIGDVSETFTPAE